MRKTKPFGRLRPAGVAFCLSLLGGVSAGRAEVSVADERVSLPDGPGSVGGVSENLLSTDNLGAMTYEVPLPVPEGFQGATPRLALGYSSMRGNESVGVGWDLHVPHIERFTLRGVPHYDRDDLFAVNGAEELVLVERGAQHQVYRARFEGGFVRYIWFSVGAGRAGYFRAEYPDGSRAFFGADAKGSAQAAALARSPTPDEATGVFRYMLVESVDPFGHRVRYRYAKRGGYPLVQRVEYLRDARDGAYRYQIDLVYENRPDPVSSGLAGFELRLSQRLAEIRTASRGTRLNRLVLHYEQTEGLSRLATVERFGVGGVRYPAAFEFAYTGALGCAHCPRPRVLDLGALDVGSGAGVDPRNGRAALIDMNGDGLPDLVDTGLGAHRFFFNELRPDGSQGFSSARSSAEVWDRSSFRLEEARVQAADLNGDGLCDMFDANTGDVLCNEGRGDWVRNGACKVARLPMQLSPDAEGADADPRGVRFFDYDGDKRSDLLQTQDRDAALVLRNAGNGVFEEIPIHGGLGKVFDQDNLQLADLNGDGLLDLVDVTHDGRVWSRLYLGRGRWQAPVTRTLPQSAGLTDFSGAELQDLDGDGLDDVVLVTSDAVHYALNRAGEFPRLERFRQQDVEGSFPDAALDHVTVLFADMNGSGTTDVVWVDASRGRVSALELMAQRPHLLTQIDNGMGAVQSVEYTTSARERARDAVAGRPWSHTLPMAVQVVKATTTHTLWAPELRSRQERSYHDGFYDGSEKRFRGFEVVEEWMQADGRTQPGRRTRLRYHLGEDDPYLHGKLRSRQVFAGEGEGERALEQVLHRYQDCQVAPLSQGVALPVVRGESSRAVRHVCETSRETWIKEGRPAEEWVELRVRRRYDGYGNEVWTLKEGVVGTGADGSGGCVPCEAPEGSASGACGATCTGDESYTETHYIPPGAATGGAWILNAPWRRLRYGVEGGPHTETLYYYDGPAFVGFEQGQLRAGRVSRECERLRADAAEDCRGAGWVQTVRRQHDAHGQVVAELDPLGVPGEEGGHLQRVRYDAAHGLKPVAISQYLTSPEGEPYRLLKEIDYDSLFFHPSRLSDWLWLGQEPSLAASGASSTRMAYDAFGRREKVAEPGDSLAAPTHQFEYQVGLEVSRTIRRTASVSGAAPDWVRVQCRDGLGRLLQTRIRVSPGQYQVSGMREFNAHGSVVREYQEHRGGPGCERGPPEGTLFTQSEYDAAGRVSRVREPDASLYGTPSVTRTEYAPLRVTTFDAEDSDPESLAHDTPRVTHADGLGRVVLREHYLEPDARPATVRSLWDSLGRLVGVVDPRGVSKRQSYDLLGRVTAVHDPNSGTTTFGYDSGSNVVVRTDARGRSIRTDYDGKNRRTARFDPLDPQGTLVRWRYDRAQACAECENGEGRVVEVSYPQGEGRGRALDEFGYDERGRASVEARTLLGHRFVTRTVHDNAGRAVAQQYPDGTRMTYAYDQASGLVAIGDVLEVAYDERGLLGEVRYRNGVRSRNEYDALRRLRGVSTRDGRGQVLQALKLQRGRMGALHGLAQIPGPKSDTEPMRVVFENDAWNRMTRADFGPDDEVVDVAYDHAHRIRRKVSSAGLSSPAHVGDYLYAAARPSALARVGEAQLRYSAAGQLEQRGGLAFERDYQGRVTRFWRVDGRTGEFVHGPGTDRVLEWRQDGLTYHVNSNFEVRDGVAFRYARLGQHRVARLASARLSTQLLRDEDASGRIDVADAWLLRATSSQARLTLRCAVRQLLLEAEGNRLFLHHDHLGSLTLATDAQGAVRGRQTFYPTGALRARSGTVDVHGFTGQRHDPDTGGVHFRFRDLDPQSGRWDAVDPLFETLAPQHLPNWEDATAGYAYVMGNLTSAVDPTGLVSLALGLQWVWVASRETTFPALREAAKRTGSETWFSYYKGKRIAGGHGLEKSIVDLVGKANKIHFNVHGVYPNSIKDFMRSRMRGFPAAEVHDSMTNFEFGLVASQSDVFARTVFMTTDPDLDKTRFNLRDADRFNKMTRRLVLKTYNGVKAEYEAEYGAGAAKAGDAMLRRPKGRVDPFTGF